MYLGSLDAPDQLTPTYECWTVRREAWLPEFPLARRYERDRESTGRSEGSWGSRQSRLPCEGLVVRPWRLSFDWSPLRGDRSDRTQDGGGPCFDATIEDWHSHLGTMTVAPAGLTL